MAHYHSQNEKKEANAPTAATILKKITIAKESKFSEINEFKQLDPEEKIG